MNVTTNKSNFKLMDPIKQREIARKGGKASHAIGHAHEWDSEAARIAGRKGALVNRKKREVKE